MKQNRLASGFILGLALAAISLAAGPSRLKAVQDLDQAQVACVVCGKKVDKAAAMKIFVKGRDQLVCSDACARELTRNPDKYLKEDGSKKP